MIIYKVHEIMLKFWQALNQKEPIRPMFNRELVLL